MELRHFAEQVLFATTLDEKLQRPAVITDEQPGPPLVTPALPGRPPELRFKPQATGKAEFPGTHRLEDERERGRLLHFFANHELLATELMALALLRFPDAPAAFRRGVLRTLQDEQVHTRLYIERMKECGIQFGQLPVSGYFWRCVSPMESPMDYVAGLSLTFEQANLDFCRHFARDFQAVGDIQTARLLERIYRDEIGHVASGLKWFRRWKNPGESDWAAFCGQLKFPLSPQRAKGVTLNVEGRRDAGLEPAFIAELNVYSQSRGRTPGVFVFNPFAEGHIARDKTRPLPSPRLPPLYPGFGREGWRGERATTLRFAPVKHQAQLARDLANLPQFLCRQDDIVLVPQRPSVEFLSGIKQAGFALPEFVEVSGERKSCMLDLAHRKLGRLRPWAWGPDSVELLAPLFASVTGEERTPSQCFNEAIAQLYSKGWSAAFLRKLLACADSESAPSRWLCTEDEVGVAVDTLADALDAIAAIRRRGHHKVVVKEALGLAGHNAIRLWEPELLDAQRQWMTNAAQNRRQLVIEPWLERELDFSVQLEITPRRLQLCGYTGLINDRKGQFQANWAAPDHNRRLPAPVTALFHEPPGIAARLRRLYDGIFARLEAELRRAGYIGPVGIDAFVYRAPEGGCRLKPVVEINPRYTMGRLTVELMKRASPGSHGMFRLVNRTMAKAEGFNDFPSYARSLTKRFPLRLEGQPAPKIREGALCLNDPAEAQVCLAVFQVSRAALGSPNLPGAPSKF